MCSLTLLTWRSLRQYKSILKKWNVGKNIKRSEMKAIVRKQVQRKLKESEKHDLKFSVRNQLVPQEKIDRFMRSEQIPRDVPYSPASGARMYTSTLDDSNFVLAIANLHSYPFVRCIRMLDAARRVGHEEHAIAISARR